MYTSVVLSIFTLLCNRSPELFNLAKPKLYPLNSSLFPALPQPLVTAILLCFCEFDYLGASYEWNHSVIVFIFAYMLFWLMVVLGVLSIFFSIYPDPFSFPLPLLCCFLCRKTGSCSPKHCI